MTLRFQDSEKIREDRRRRRLIGVAAFLVIAYLTVMGRAVQLALQDNEKLEEIAMSQYRMAIQQETERNRILDVKGHELAISVPSWSLYTDPSKVEKADFAAVQLAKVLKMSTETLLRKLKQNR